MNETKKQAERFDIFLWINNFFYFLRRWWFPILAASLVAAAVGGYRVWHSYSPVYRSEAVLSASYVSTGSLSDITGYISSYSSTSSASQLVSSFSAIISTDAMRQKILQQLGTSYIAGNISASQISGTNLFNVTVTSSDPQTAYDILQAVIASYPAVAQNIVGSTQIIEVSSPTLPTEPLYQRVWIPTAVKYGGAMLVLLLLVLFLVAQTRHVVHSTEDIRRVTGMDRLGHMPLVRRKKRQSGQEASLSILSPTTPAFYSESVRTVRTRLIHNLEKAGIKSGVIMVTSTLPGEGKSTVAANLAVSLSQLGKKVILVDGDLRVQELHEFLRAEGEGKQGLAAILSGNAPNALEVCAAVPDAPHLRLISGGDPVNNPAGLLRADKVRRVLQELRAYADYIVVDTPPIGLLSDAASFLDSADGVVYVIREEYASLAQITASLQTMADRRARMLGYVYNCTEGSTGQYGYGKYGSRYGYGGYGGYGQHGKYGSKYGSGYSRYDHYAQQGAAETTPEEAAAEPLDSSIKTSADIPEDMRQTPAASLPIRRAARNADSKQPQSAAGTGSAGTNAGGSSAAGPEASPAKRAGPRHLRKE